MRKNGLSPSINVLSRKKEKVEAGMEQSSCRTVSIRLQMLDTAQVWNTETELRFICT